MLKICETEAHYLYMKFNVSKSMISYILNIGLWSSLCQTFYWGLWATVSV